MRAAWGEPREYFYRTLYTVTPECKVWPYGAVSGGYGALEINGQQYAPHHLACLAWNGPPPPGHEAAHGPCHNRRCHNGAHLTWRTPRQQWEDQVRDGTALLGEKNHAAILTAELVMEIRRKYAAGGVRQEDLAAQYGLQQCSVSDLIRGHTWSHLPGARPPIRRLTETEVEAVLREYAAGGITQRALAVRYGVSAAMVSLLVNGKNRTWKRKP